MAPPPSHLPVEHWPTLDLWYSDLSQTHKTFIDQVCKPAYLTAPQELLEKDYKHLHLYSFVVWRYEGLQDTFRRGCSGGNNAQRQWPIFTLPVTSKLPSFATVHDLLGPHWLLTATKSLLLAMRTCLRDTYAHRFKQDIEQNANVSLLRLPRSEREGLC